MPNQKIQKPGNNSKYAAGDKFGDWVLKDQLGVGGNGDVWRASHSKLPDHAIKILRSVSGESYERFKIEVAALEKLNGMDGIIPLIEKHLPEDKKHSTPWFIMPIAEPFEKYKINKTPSQLAEDFISLAETLEALHGESITHRDIKPANFLYYNNRLCLSDFGLVKYPNRPTITPLKRDVGAKFTMAPEMRRHASKSNGKPADVYSLAKSLWIALTDEELGFDGQYNPDSTLALRNYLEGTYTTTLDQLLVECTDGEPLRRPSISQVSGRIAEWLKLITDFHKRNITEWTEVQQKLFPLGAPSRSTWTDIDAICSTLNEIAKVRALNHMFYPTGGGNTITGVGRAAEDGMIELHVGDTAEILKPEKLTYESFPGDPNLNYFRLEVAPIKPKGIKGALDPEKIREEMTELTPGVYIPYEHWIENDYNGEALPETARSVSRYIRGSFVFFSTRSRYNLTPGTYDARHDKRSESEFREYISRSAQKANTNKK